MFDLWHEFGSDLAVGPTGDLAVVTGTTLGQQRVLRRLLTNAGDYIWQLNYGAGLGQFVGQPAAGNRIRAVIRSQIFKEAAVARMPEPKVGVLVDPGGTVAAQISYSDSESGETVILELDVGSGG
jgi:hypothetical protein